MEPTKFEISDYLDDPQVIVSYLNTVLEEGTSDELIVALGHITKAIGMTKIAEKTGSLFVPICGCASTKISSVAPWATRISMMRRISPRFLDRV